MKTNLSTKIEYKISDVIDEVTACINELDPDIAGEDDEIYDLMEIRDNLKNAITNIEDIRTRKYIY